MARASHLVEIHADRDKVRQAFTELSGVRGWWTEDAELIPGQSSKTFHFRFGKEYFNKMQVLQEEHNLVQWKCVDGADEWVGTTLNFSFETDPKGATILRFKHDGWREESDFFAFCNTIWGYYMESIKSLCEKGRGTPAPKA